VSEAPMRKHASRVALLLIPLGVVLLLVLLVPAAFAGSITNGSFEAVQIGAPFNSSNSLDIPGWTHGGSAGDALLWAVGYSDSFGSVTTAGAGNQFVTMGGGFGVAGTADWSTTITGLTPGTMYLLSFMTATEQGPEFPFPGTVFAQTMTVGFLSGSSTAARSFTSPISSADYWRTWVKQDYLFLATATSATVDFSVTGQAEDMGLDNVSVAPAVTTTPELSTLLLFGTSLLGLAPFRRKLFGR
jgi:hypothetical protein